MNNARGQNEWQETYGSGFGFGATERLVQIPPEMLDPWKDEDGREQPFHKYSQDKLEDLAENIRQNGIIHPICARTKGSRFEIIAGHNRCAAAKLAGLRTVPVIIKEMDDNAAAILLVDSNLKQRESILPSEKAFAYKLKLEAMKRQGKRNDLTSGQIGPKSQDGLTSGQFGPKSGNRSNQELATQVGESVKQIQRYIRLTFLIPGLLELVDKGVLKLIAAVDISYLPQDIQEILLDLIIKENVKMSTAKATELKKAMPQNELEVRAILEGKPKTPTLKISLELDEMDIAKLSGNRDFQKEAKKLLADLARHYLQEDE